MPLRGVNSVTQPQVVAVAIGRKPTPARNYLHYSKSSEKPTARATVSTTGPDNTSSSNPTNVSS